MEDKYIIAKEAREIFKIKFNVKDKRTFDNIVEKLGIRKKVLSPRKILYRESDILNAIENVN